ncbi:hypothetical protein JMUB6875_44320 [Nocardia sp. JMUB6875]
MYVAAVVAGLAIMAPVDLEQAARSRSAHLDILANDTVHAAAVGVLIAVVVAIVATVHGSVRVGWGIAVCGTVILLADHLAAGSAPAPHELLALMYSDAGGGGLVLGGLAGAVVMHSAPAAALTTGALTTAVIGNRTSLADRAADRAQPADRWEWHLLDSPPRWLVLIALILVLATGIANRRARHRRWVGVFPFASACGGLLVVATAMLGWDWLAAGGSSLPRAVAAGGLIIAGVTAAAFLLPGLDGAIALLATAFTVVWGELAPVRLPVADLIVLPILIAVGYFAGLRRRSALLGWTALVTVAVAVACSGQLRHTAMVAVVPVLGAAVGYAWAASTPIRKSSRAVTIPLLFTPSIVLGFRQHLRAADGIADAPDWAAVVLVLSCFLGFGALRAVRKGRRCAIGAGRFRCGGGTFG